MTPADDPGELARDVRGIRALSAPHTWCEAPRHRFTPAPALRDRCQVCLHARHDGHGQHIPWWKFWERPAVQQVQS